MSNSTPQSGSNDDPQLDRQYENSDHPIIDSPESNATNQVPNDPHDGGSLPQGAAYSPQSPQYQQPQPPQYPPQQSPQYQLQPQYQQPQSPQYPPSGYPYPPQPQPYPPQPPVNPEIARHRALRRTVGRPAGLVLAYQGVFTAASFVGGAVMGVLATIQRVAGDHLSQTPSAETLNRIEQDLAQTSLQWIGVLSIISVVVGFLFMLLMRHRTILTRAFWLGDPAVPNAPNAPAPSPHARMRPAWFAVFVALIIGIQGVLQLIQIAFAALGTPLVSPTSESIDEAATTVSMWLYIGLLGPIVEEVVFRGVLMRELKPLGRNFAIVTSSFMFALFHDDVVQGLFAFGCGLVFAFVAMEYSLIWSIALHMFNNAIISGVLAEFAASFGDTGSIAYGVALMIIGIVGLVAVLVKYGWGLREYVRVNRSAPGTYWGWTSGLFLTFVIINGMAALGSFTVAMTM